MAAHKNNQCSRNIPSVLKDCFRNIDYFHFTTSGTSFLRQINIPRLMICRGAFTTPTTTPNHYYLPSKNTYLQNNTFLPFCNCLCIIEGIGIGLSKMTEKISQMKVYFKLISLGQRQLLLLSKTADAYFENNTELFTDTVQMFPYFIWHFIISLSKYARCDWSI